MVNNFIIALEDATHKLQGLCHSPRIDSSPSTENPEHPIASRKLLNDKHKQPKMKSFLDLPPEVRCDIYRALVSNGVLYSHVGLILSCKQVYHEAEYEFIKYTSAYLVNMEVQLNAQLPQPIRIVMPSRFADLNRVTLH